MDIKLRVRFLGLDFALLGSRQSFYFPLLQSEGGFRLNNFLDDFTTPFSQCPERVCVVKKKSVLFRQWALVLTHSSTVPYSVVWVLEPLLDFFIIPGIRMHIKYVWRGGGVYMQLDSEHIREYYGACSDFPLILSFCTHSNFHGLYTIICPSL